jgi:crotonobetainyl-CoA:carnitine CoA-transferase CaiB-like acyl-CoA transferase
VTEEQWRALSELMGRPELARDPRFVAFDARILNQDALDQIIADWTSNSNANVLELKLQSSGIPASKVASSDDMYHDPQLSHRNHFVEVEHSRVAKIPIEASAYVLSRTPGRIERGAPTLGRDTAHVLEKMLGYRPEQIAALGARGVLK